MNENSNLIWYAVYGSNLNRDRFMHYIEGGTPTGGLKAYEACTDTTPPKDERAFEIQHELIFAKASPPWQGGGVAFVLPTQDARARTHAKLYLITREQFSHIAKSETGGTPINNIDFDAAIQEGGTVFKTPSWYGLALYLGEVDRIPVLTLTNEAAIETYTKPSPQYLTQIVLGLRQTHGFSNQEIYEYLKTKKGIVGQYKDYELYDVTAGLLDPVRDTTRVLFSDYAREYDAMPEGEQKTQMKLAMDELMRQYYGGFNFEYLQ